MISPAGVLLYPLAGLIVRRSRPMCENGVRWQKRREREREDMCEMVVALLQVDGSLITWEKWHIRTSFNYREGLVLHNVG